MTGGGAGVRARLGNKYVLLGAQLLVLAAVLVSYNGGRWRFPAYRVDLDVYRLGSAALLHGQALYGTLPPTGDGQFLLFTYPPFAAIVLAPLALLPYWAACLALTLLTLGVLAVVLVTVLRALGARCDWPRVAALLLAAEVLEPVLRTLYAGQIDLLLLALVVLDVLVDTPRWPRGLLIGIAAAVKLTPAVFLLYFLLRRDRRAAVTAIVTFVAATALGFLLAGADSVRYWTGALWDTGRVGEPTYAGDQSLLGLLARAGVPPQARTAWWLPLVAVVLVLTALGVRRALAARETTVALGLNAIGGLLVSPISWTHHWVWAAVVLLGWAELARRTRRRGFAVLAGAGAVLFVAGPQWWWPHGGEVERQWNFLQQLTGNGYVLFGLTVLLTAVLVRFPERTGPVSAAVPARAGASPLPG
ncbi:glycosyltransferase 87 family protein [Amycolatopsis mediterranei]|uniref:glycosyltransferase 87 family protein n=1 Tax=Amycolatopsis mediterranei TaxID=33910 RepID=UPI001E368F41|nr:glycosyltransferase 87 family protein [Amycolatopsis mediterranei]UZF70087.1 glycosyltransferase 87 family protein [Amycolatopsis mediterranei]